MLKIALSRGTYEKYPLLKEHLEGLKSYKDQTLYRVYCINTLESSEYDIYITNIDLYPQLVVDNSRSYFIFIGNDLSKMVLHNDSCNNYFLKEPLDLHKLDEVLRHIRRKIQNNYIVLTTTKGLFRIKINELNFINIENRALSYHLACNRIERGMSLTGSFKNAINPLQDNDLLFFMPPALLVNLNHIRLIGKNTLLFDSGEELYIPSTYYEPIKIAWEEYHQFDNMI